MGASSSADFNAQVTALLSSTTDKISRAEVWMCCAGFESFTRFESGQESFTERVGFFMMRVSGITRITLLITLVLSSQVQESIKSINSLAKETQQLEFCRDTSGATIINQYVVVKALGEGSFGKVSR